MIYSENGINSHHKLDLQIWGDTDILQPNLTLTVFKDQADQFASLLLEDCPHRQRLHLIPLDITVT